MKQDQNSHKPSFNLSNFLWNAWCCLSIIGIWPRFIEHRLLKTTQLNLKIPNLPDELHGLKIVQFSDLHLHSKVTDGFLQKIKRKVEALQPDIILFTGDFLCFSLLNEEERLQNFFGSLHAPYGCFAVLGNHDYAEFISINENGEYDVLTARAGSFKKIFRRLWTNTTLAFKATERAKRVKYHTEFEKLLLKTSFKLLKNESMLVPIKGSFLNITGLEEYTTGHCNPLKAFQNYDNRYPGIIMSHNPDSVPSLLKFPGDIILSGHTHGGQVNLPWLWKKFTLMENPHLKKGLFYLQDKWVYVNRGVGSVMQFRWFAPPELLSITLSDST